MEIKFVECNVLHQRSTVDPMPPDACDTFLVSQEAVLTFTDSHNQFGHDVVRLFPAWVGGKRAFMVRRCWCASYGYSAAGTFDMLVTFEEGVRMLAESQVYSFTCNE